MKMFKEVLWHTGAIGVGILLAVISTGCQLPNNEKIICGQDGSLSKRTVTGPATLIRTTQTCTINPDGTFTVKDKFNDN